MIHHSPILWDFLFMADHSLPYFKRKYNIWQKKLKKFRKSILECCRQVLSYPFWYDLQDLKCLQNPLESWIILCELVKIQKITICNFKIQNLSVLILYVFVPETIFSSHPPSHALKISKTRLFLAVSIGAFLIFFHAFSFTGVNKLHP